MRKSLAVAGAVMALGVAAGPAVAAPHVVVWAGGLGPTGKPRGAEVAADGSVRRLSQDADGHVHTKGSSVVRGAKLARIVNAAGDVLAHAPSVSRDPEIADGSYVSVGVTDGAKSRLIWDENKDPSQVSALLRAVNAVLPRSQRLLGSSGAQVKVSSRVPGDPLTVAKCAPGQQVVTATKNVSLRDAVFIGAVSNVQAKGVAGGDSFSFDAGNLSGVAAGSAVLDINVQVTGAGFQTFPGDPANSPQNLSNLLRDTVTSDPARTNFHVPNGTPDGMDVNINYHFSPRLPGAPADPCAIQVLLVNNPHEGNSDNDRGFTSNADPANGVPGAVNMHTNLSNGPESMAGTFQHEIGHAAFGARDQYQDVWHPNDNSGDIPLPSDAAAADAGAYLSSLGLDATDGEVQAAVDPTAAINHDVMGYSQDPSNTYLPSMFASALAHARLFVKGDPGTLFVPKNGGNQSFTLAGFLNLLLPDGAKIHEDGIVAYCTDLLNHDTPAPGDVYDVLPTAGELGGEAMTALQRVSEVVAAREPGPLEETPGANAAIWRVTDDVSVDRDANPAAASILDAAGVPLDASQKTYNAPHFVDPAAGIPGTVGLSSPTSAVPVHRAPLPAPVSKATLTRLTSAKRVRIVRGHGRARRRTGVAIMSWVTLLGKADRVSLALTRTRGHRTVTVARTRPRVLSVGGTPMLLLVRSPRPGRYRLVARGAHGGTRTLAITLTPPRRRRR